MGVNKTLGLEPPKRFNLNESTVGINVKQVWIHNCSNCGKLWQEDIVLPELITFTFKCKTEPIIPDMPKEIVLHQKNEDYIEISNFNASYITISQNGSWDKVIHVDKENIQDLINALKKINNK